MSGLPGVGKSFLAQALGHAALRAGSVVLYCSVFDLVREMQSDQSLAEAQRTLPRYLKPDLLCIDDFGMNHFPPKSAETLLELVVRRHQNRSMLMTSNRPIEDWGQLLGDAGPLPPASRNHPDHRRSYRLRHPLPSIEKQKSSENQKNKGEDAQKK